MTRNSSSEFNGFEKPPAGKYKTIPSVKAKLFYKTKHYAVSRAAQLRACSNSSSTSFDKAKNTIISQMYF
jgi:hypothetical protein